MPPISYGGNLAFACFLHLSKIHVNMEIEGAATQLHSAAYQNKSRENLGIIVAQCTSAGWRGG
jgi:hypothetical protein